MEPQPQHSPQGAIRKEDGSVEWRVWAPRSQTVHLMISPAQDRREIAMRAENFGYFTYQLQNAEEGLTYDYRLADGREYPDPASRWQPQGVHRPSAVFFPENYQWSDTAWRGLPRHELVIYELHTGAFTPEGTFQAILPRLPQLRKLGVTALEIMPVAQFPGERSWGYDSVHPFAVQNSYGGPHALQRLIDAAHQAGLAVFLDVIYNHLGPEGNYLANFAPYFTDRYHTPWGAAINYDGPESDPVRQFVIDNACMWIRDFHFDGLRLDAVQTIYDFSPRHILADIKAVVAQVAESQNRIVHVIAETNQNDVRLITSTRQGGYGLDGLWNDDFHHAVHALLTGERDGYYVDFGRPQHLEKTYRDVFVYDGCYSPFYKRRQGASASDLDRNRFVVCIQNHDQVGNRAQGDRLAALVPPAAQRLACGLLLVSPFVPLLFMGEEYGESRPFPFFCSFGDPQLIEAVRRGRREEFAALAFKWKKEVPDPHAAETFAGAKLSWQWPDGSRQAGLRRLYADLLAARRNWPPWTSPQDLDARLVEVSSGDSATPGIVLVLQRGAARLKLYANLTALEEELPAQGLSAADLLLSTEAQRYGGARTPSDSIERLKPYEMLIFGRGA
jgi:maltooligosyltrehalose trehalohydrolase